MRLVEIKQLAELARIKFTAHAARRMDERGVKPPDVSTALMSATAAIAQNNGCWRVEGGCDRDGDDLTLIVDIEDDVIVVTIF